MNFVLAPVALQIENQRQMLPVAREHPKPITEHLFKVYPGTA